MSGISDMSALRAEMCEAVTAPPLCKNCEHCSLPIFANQMAWCRRPLKPAFDIVDGETTLRSFNHPSRERGRTSLLDCLFGRTRCGPLGLYFKPKARPSTSPPPMGGSGISAPSAPLREPKTADSFRRALRKIASLDTSRSSLNVAQDIARKALK